MKYEYILKDKDYKTFSITSDSKNIEEYLQGVNGVYKRLAWVVQVDNKAKKIKEYLIHQKNGVISEYALV